MHKGEISILMAVYNCEDTIEQSIDSVIAQTYKDWHMIICDDCSTDGTGRIISDYAKKYPEKFTIIRNQNNSKLAFSLNRCIELAEGEYSARMDGDDFVSPERFEKQVAYLKAHPEISLVSSWMQVFNEDGLGRVIKYKEFPDKIDLHRGPCFAHATVLMYTSVYKELGGYTVSPRTVRSQDYDLWFRFFAKGFKGANYQEVLYYVREDQKAFLRRKPRLYFWAIITRWKGFRLVKMPLRLYPWILYPLIGLAGNIIRKAKFSLDFGVR